MPPGAGCGSECACGHAQMITLTLTRDRGRMVTQAQKAEAALLEQQEVAVELRAKLVKAQRVAEPPAKASLGVQVTARSARAYTC